MVTYKRSSYWIPPDFARKKIDIEEEIENGRNKLNFYFKGLRIVEHTQSPKPGGWILPPDYKLKGRRGRMSQERKAEIEKMYTTDIQIREITYYDNLQ